jgi:hypothetical protein
VVYTNEAFMGTKRSCRTILQTLPDDKSLRSPNTMPDYIPRTDGDFDHWFSNFVDYALQNCVQLGLGEGEIAELLDIRSRWEMALSKHRAAREAARLATREKEKQRTAGEQTIRKHVRVIQARPATTNEQRRSLGITAKSDEQNREYILSTVHPHGY